MRRSVVGFVATVAAIAALQTTALIGVTSSAWAEDAPVEPSPVVKVDAPVEPSPVVKVDAPVNVTPDAEGGTPAADDVQPEGDAPKVAVQEELDAQGNVNRGNLLAATFNLYRVKLIQGTPAFARDGSFRYIPGTIDVNDRTVLAETSDKLNLHVAVDYRIEMLGNATDWGIRAGLDQGAQYGYGTCSVEFRPADPDTPQPDSKPFTCTADPRNGGNVNFFVALNNSGESSGSLTTHGDRITLSEGDFVQGLPYSVPGTKTVDKNTKTTFSTVLRGGDSPIDANQARTQFSYRIVDKGVATNLYVAGWVTNFRGSVGFSGDGHCGIYSIEPSKLGTIKLEDAAEDISAYTCTGIGGVVHDEWSSGRNHWNADFTVSRRATIVKADPGEQTRLVQNYCGIVGRCGMSMATVTDSFATPGIRLTDAINGPAEVEYIKAHTEGVSISNGFKITGETETNWLIEKLKITLEYNFKYETTKETTTKTGYRFPVEKGETAYLEGNPHMVHAEGVIIVIDNAGTYWELPGFSASFPSIDGLWTMHVVRTPLSVGAPTPGGGTIPPAAIIPVAAQPTAGRLADTGVETPAGRLANTGVETPAMPALIGIALLGAGALFTVIGLLRRRGARTR